MTGTEPADQLAASLEVAVATSAKPSTSVHPGRTSPSRGRACGGVYALATTLGFSFPSLSSIATPATALALDLRAP